MSVNAQPHEVTFTPPWEVFKPYFSYLTMFLGMGLISGSIVHAAQPDMRAYALGLMAIGAVLFAFGSYLNEVLFKTGILGDSVVKYVLVSLLLAVGIGMVSGAAQHFNDTPIFASYSAPIGVFISSLAFAIRQGYVLHRQSWFMMILAGLAFAMVFHLGLRAYAESLPVSQGHHGQSTAMAHAGEGEAAHVDAHGSTAPEMADGHGGETAANLESATPGATH
ncbi:hypothetical protein ACR03S_19425 (plasmid) [Limimaricola variabilis]|jgi:hypothetical protein|uniref:hypothetical protein n=1 Tax=Limimaricola variabilis TaxID=1492771 RepID=UPI002AC8B0F1|nr:hypothetical protein [Limimaricola variabilis]WPY97016.1 hypothetical protein T8T21_20285 [Limimaricola variabilis]